MIIKQLTEIQQMRFDKHLEKEAHRRNYTPLYDLNVRYNEKAYVLTLLRDKKRSVAVLYATLYEKCEDGGEKKWLVTKPSVLESLLNLLLLESRFSVR